VLMIDVWLEARVISSVVGEVGSHAEVCLTGGRSFETVGVNLRPEI
jgi:hypothetical protein